MSAVHFIPFAQIQRGRPLPSKELLRTQGHSPVSWEIIVPERRRERALEGVFLGCAIAEAIQHVVCASDIRSARKRSIRLLSGSDPMVMMPGHRLDSMILTIQSLLLSRTGIDRFAKGLKRRLWWYRVTRPFSWLAASAGSNLNSSLTPGLSASLGTDPLARAAILSVVLQGHSHAGLRWIQRSTVATHSDAMVVGSCMIVAIAMQAAQLTGSDYELSRDEIFPLLREATSDPELRDRLSALASLMAQGRTLLSAARLLGYRGSLTPCLVDAALLGIYAWLRYRGDYRKTVEEVTMLGGEVCSAAVVAGALAGAELGVDGIPAKWIEQTNMDPYDALWRERYIERLRDWPHGPEDIQRTKVLPIMPLGQVKRNALFGWWWMTLPVRRAVYRVSHAERKSR